MQNSLYPSEPSFFGFLGLIDTQINLRPHSFLIIHRHASQPKVTFTETPGGGGGTTSLRWRDSNPQHHTWCSVRGVRDSAPNHKTTCPPHLIFLFIPFINYQRLTVNNLPAPPARPSVETPRISSAVLSTAAPVRPRC